MPDEIDIIENIDVEEKISATGHPGIRIATRRFIEESCELAKMLPPHKKLIFVMHYSHGYSVKEIANLCGVSTGTVTSKLKAITREINVMRRCLKGSENGKTDKSTKERIEGYFRREAERRRSVRKRKNISKSL